MSCPIDVKRRADILECNSFKGFQSPGTGAGADSFMICWCDDNLSDHEVNKIKELSGSQTLYYGDYIGRGYMTIKWNEYNKITNVFNAMLTRKHWFRTGTKGEAGFNPDNDIVFTFELMEFKTIKQLKELIGLCPGYVTEKYPISDVYCDIWNYTTNEGKEFCNFLRQKRNLPPADYNHENNYYNWDIFKNCNFATLQTIVINNNNNNDNNNKEVKNTNQQERNNDDIDENMCMICLCQEANTMVLPCEHCVVCKECSNGLKNTNDRHICVRCRRPITHVLV